MASKSEKQIIFSLAAISAVNWVIYLSLMLKLYLNPDGGSPADIVLLPFLLALPILAISNIIGLIYYIVRFKPVWWQSIICLLLILPLGYYLFTFQKNASEPPPPPEQADIISKSEAINLIKECKVREVGGTATYEGYLVLNFRSGVYASGQYLKDTNYEELKSVIDTSTCANRTTIYSID